jgi:hypothetical protein
MRTPAIATEVEKLRLAAHPARRLGSALTSYIDLASARTSCGALVEVPSDFGDCTEISYRFRAAEPISNCAWKARRAEGDRSTAARGIVGGGVAPWR